MWSLRRPDHPEAKDRLIEMGTLANRERVEQSQQPKRIHRNVSNLRLLICGDILAILLWFAMFIYALLLWYSHGKREIDLQDHMFDPSLLMEFARPVCLQIDSFPHLIYTVVDPSHNLVRCDHRSRGQVIRLMALTKRLFNRDS